MDHSREIVCVPAPRLSIADNRLHRADGPAVEWPSGVAYWVWKGVPVSQHVVEAPRTITFEEIKREPNAEVRRCMTERFGYERYLGAAGAEKIHEGEFGILWRCREKRTHNQKQNIEERIDEISVVEVLDGTAQPDGTRRRYFLSVPPTCLTAKEAVAWTYGLTADQYGNLVQQT